MPTSVQGRRGGHYARPVATEHMRRPDDLQPNAVALVAAERRLHLGHEREVLALMLERDMDEHLRPEILHRADVRLERPAFDDLQRLGTEAHRDPARAVAERRRLTRA